MSSALSKKLQIVFTILALSIPADPLPPLAPAIVSSVTLAIRQVIVRRSAVEAMRAVGATSGRQVRRLTKQCQTLLNRYQSLKGTPSCKDSCMSISPNSVGNRTSCYSEMISQISDILTRVNLEIDARSVFARYCEGFGRRKGRRNNERWTDDEGHREQIEILKKQRAKCIADVVRAQKNLNPPNDTFMPPVNPGIR